MQGEGHFVALLHKKGELVKEVYPAARSSKVPAEIQEFVKEFTSDFDLTHMEIQGEKVYLLPKETDNLKGIRTLRTGLLLGELKKNRFEPSQALAMTVKPDEYSTVVDFKADSSSVVKYLKGETIEADEGRLRGNAKNVLITVDGYPLGWGKLNGTSIKNKYLPGWRWM